MLAFALLLPVTAPAQSLTRPAIPWQSIHTAHFDIHFPSEMRAWATDVASRIESATDAVSAMVGNRPTRRVTVMIEDPSNVANGFALPFLEGPVVFLWPTPPAPSPSFGEFRDWGEILAVHEYGHIAHLTFPSRNPRESLFWRLMPVSIGPVARKSPAWVIEGYATLIEGRLTANGRPNGVGRPAVIRQFAREGRLPTYGALDAVGPFMGGAMRYLVGSAFLEWLERRKGPESLNHVWRRMSARVNRSFDEAFIGVYGASPADLYGRFVAEATADAMAIEAQIVERGASDGTLVQKLAWSTGEPALSPAGDRVALVLRSATLPSKLVVWSTAPPNDSARQRRRRAILARDPQDVAPFDSFPPPPHTLATLESVNGRGSDHPRFFADGRRVLVSREEARGDGTTRPDLFIWDTKSGALSRVTHGAAIRDADPSPDGKRAVGARCIGGVCDLVVIELESGRLRTIAAGSPTVTWHRPRWSPDGWHIAASVHRDGRWTIEIVTLTRFVDPQSFTLDSTRNTVLGVNVAKLIRAGPDDGAERYSPEWTGDGRALVVVSEAGGVANLARIDLATNAERTLTRMVGAAMSPATSRSDSMVYFLSLHAKGLDVRRVSIGANVGEAIAVTPDDSPVRPQRASPAATFARGAFDGPHAYGLGPRRWRVLPGGSVDPDGASLTLAVANTDPVGRLGLLAQGAWGQPGTWRGASLSASLRALPVQLDGALFATTHEPSRAFGPPLASTALDATLIGGSIATTFDRDWLSRRFSISFGASAMSFDDDSLARRSSRTFGFGHLSVGVLRGRGDTYLSAAIAGDASAGSTAGTSWTRGLGTLSLAARAGSFGARASGTLGGMSHGDASSFERFTLGGVAPPLFDRSLLAQRIALPAVPVGYVSGSRIEVLRVAVTRFPMLVLPVTPYAVWARGGDSFSGDWHRVVGAETEMDFPSLAFASVPGVHVVGGAGYALDEPFRRKARVYLSLSYRP